MIYKNVFTGTNYPIRFGSGASKLWWDNWEGVVFGKADNNMYLEDNEIHKDNYLEGPK